MISSGIVICIVHSKNIVVGPLHILRILRSGLLLRLLQSNSSCHFFLKLIIWIISWTYDMAYCKSGFLDLSLVINQETISSSLVSRLQLKEQILVGHIPIMRGDNPAMYCEGIWSDCYSWTEGWPTSPGDSMCLERMG